MQNVREFIRFTSQTSALHPTLGWVPAKPLAEPWTWRIRDAWTVLRGQAVAVCYDDFSVPTPAAPGRVPGGEG